MSERADQSNRLNARIQGYADAVGNSMLGTFHIVALFGIGVAVMWSAVVTFVHIFDTGHHATIEDILLLFIYLELGAMVGIYFKTKHMPVRFLIYVAITALTRMLIGHIGTHHVPDLGILLICGAILLLSVGALVLRFGSYKYPSSGVLYEIGAEGRTGDGKGATS